MIAWTRFLKFLKIIRRTNDSRRSLQEKFNSPNKEVRETTRKELEKKHEEECPKYKLLSNITDLSCRACDRSLHASVVSIMSIILSAIAIILHFV